MISKLISNKLLSNCYRIKYCSETTSNPILNNVRFAGHSHWQNVKETKESKDKIKSCNATLISRLMLNAIKEGDGIRDPKLNSHLAAVIERARSLNVSLAKLDKILSKNETVDPYFIEFQAPGGIFLVIESCNKQMVKEKTTIVSIVKKYGFKLAPVSFLKIAFSYKGEVGCKPDKNILSNDDQALEVALEVGADEVVYDKDEETDCMLYKFHCDPNSVTQIKSALLNKKLEVAYSTDYLTPLNRVQITDEMKNNLDEMFSKIYEAHDTVHRIFDNIE